MEARVRQIFEDQTNKYKMSADRTEALGNQIVGQTKEVVGSIGDAIGLGDDLKKEGQEQHSKGDIQYEAKQKKEKAEATADNISGTLQEHVAGAFSDKQKAKGKAKQLKADAKDEKSKH